MKINKTISSETIKDFLELKSLISNIPPASISNKFHNVSIDNCINIINNEVNSYLKMNLFNVEIEKTSIKLLDKKIHNYEVIGAKNIFSALLLEGCLNIDKNVDKKSIEDLLSTFQHEKFVHVPESHHYLSSEIVYEDENFYVVFIKDIKMFKAFKY